jgi:hypothetical protein
MDSEWENADRFGHKSQRWMMCEVIVWEIIILAFPTMTRYR